MTTRLADLPLDETYPQNHTFATLRSTMPFTLAIAAGVLCVLTAVAFILLTCGLRSRRREYSELDNSLPVHSPDEKHRVVFHDVASPTLIGSPLPLSIVDSVDIDRADWVQRLTAHVSNERHRGRYNVLTIHTKIDYHFAHEGVVEKIPSSYTDANNKLVIPYETVIFEQGNLVRLGDGGYINWCFHGNFKRDDNVVNFFPI